MWIPVYLLFFFFQGSPIPAITVTDEHANTQTVTVEHEDQEPQRENTENPPQTTAQEAEVRQLQHKNQSTAIYSRDLETYNCKTFTIVLLI